jgi:hypothetical protein
MADDNYQEDLLIKVDLTLSAQDMAELDALQRGTTINGKPMGPISYDPGFPTLDDVVEKFCLKNGLEKDYVTRSAPYDVLGLNWQVHLVEYAVPGRSTLEKDFSFWISQVNNSQSYPGMFEGDSGYCCMREYTLHGLIKGEDIILKAQVLADLNAYKPSFNITRNDNLPYWFLMDAKDKS